MGFLVLIVVLIIVRATIVSIGDNNRLRSNLVVMNRSPQSFVALGAQIEELQRMTLNIDNYRLVEIKSALEKTARLAGNAKTEFQAQYDAWVYVQSQSTKDKENFLQLRQKLDDVQKLQDREIVRLKKLLDESTKSSLLDYSFTLLLSFGLGILSSMIAARIHDYWKEDPSRLKRLLRRYILRSKP